MSSRLMINESVWVAETALSWRFSRSSGPGGQGVNTTDSRVELSVNLDDISGMSEDEADRAESRLSNRLVDNVITITASEFRSQLRNRQAARDRMCELLRKAIDPGPKSRRKTKPSRGANRRRLEHKKHRSELKKLRGRIDE